MKRATNWCNLYGFIVLLLCEAAVAQNLPNASLRTVSLDQTIEFKSLNQMVITTRVETEALTEHGAQQLTKHVYGFNGALEKVELLDAFTLKKSGTKIALAKEGRSSQKGYVSSGVGITMPEWEQHQLAFPSLEIGDRTVIKTIHTVNKAPLSGWLSYSAYLWPAQEIQKAYWRIEAPQNLMLHVRSTLADQKSPTTKEGLTVWEFQGSIKAKAIDQNPTSTRVSVPYLVASTIEQHEDVARLFAHQVLAKAVITDEIKNLTAQIIKGKTDDLTKTRAIYDWVRKNLKYTAIYLANGGWEPHDTAHILNTRYGDCKDHVTLMFAMLKAASVDAQAVLINTSNEYVADPLPVAGSYNHTILYVPSLGKYLDPTGSQIPFDGASWALIGRPVVRSDGINASTGRTPVVLSVENTIAVQTTMTIAADGSAKMHVQHDVTGIAAFVMQERLVNYRQEFEATEVRRLLANSGWTGSGKLTHSPMDRDVWRQSMSWDISIHDFLQDTAAGSINVHPGLSIDSHISSLTGSYVQEKRDFGGPCGAYQVKESFHVSFDPRFKVLRIPKPLEVNVLGIRFKSTPQINGQVVQGTREISFDSESAECTPQEYARRRVVMNQIARHLRSPVLFMQPE
jgi:transglutaminase-like putative cysteine protease